MLEKHYQSFTSRSSVELFTEQALKTQKRDDVPPIITTAKYHLVNIYRNGLYMLATVTGEVRPSPADNCGIYCVTVRTGTFPLSAVVGGGVYH